MSEPTLIMESDLGIACVHTRSDVLTYKAYTKQSKAFFQLVERVGAVIWWIISTDALVICLQKWIDVFLLKRCRGKLL